MNKIFQSNTFKILRNVFQMVIAIAYLSTAYFFVLFMVLEKEDLSNNIQIIILIYITGIGQITNYLEKYKGRGKNFFFYAGVLAPSIAMLAIAAAAVKIYLLC